MYSDIATARSMLPHRTNFVPQFHAHGFMLIPETLLSPLTALQQQQLQLAGGAEDAEDTDAVALQQRRRRRQGGSAEGQAALYADSVKRKRKLKMKKHKYKKRMRALAASKQGK
ncbi:hypothetical protein MNEG_8529 [Monoraphidium neglectum]|jgi:hypothetical protein|uniref:Small ribosomal subunit protein mS38 n=1 Tax=Monoraphidium neglectum TaxID=145388 RepID=A0A0D2MFD2_9CHLO|nr:hypothetical protein MNEG_8529 [Monoraphidium neglectum]KIY99431.1 hypothetical protein MNEG_8529 [Monoraphidium neglectum]|eukprot:XP_013898451.1 hypothetical protein MNEG_8529 [Monoraphidium neglectum]